VCQEEGEEQEEQEEEEEQVEEEEELYLRISTDAGGEPMNEASETNQTGVAALYAHVNILL